MVEMRLPVMGSRLLFLERVILDKATGESIAIGEGRISFSRKFIFVVPAPTASIILHVC